MVKYNVMTRAEGSSPNYSEKDIYQLLDIAYNFYNPPSDIPLGPLQRQIMLAGLRRKSKEILEIAGYEEMVRNVEDEALNFFSVRRKRSVALRGIERHEQLSPDKQDKLRDLAQDAFSTPLQEPDFRSYLDSLPQEYGGALLVFGTANFEIVMQIEARLNRGANFIDGTNNNGQ